MREEEKRWYRIRGNFFFQTVLFVVLSILEYLTIEVFLDGNIAKIGWEYGIKNIAILVGGNLILTSLFHQMRPAFILSEIAVLVLGIANYFVDAFRGYGIVYMDFFAVKTAANVAGDYSYSLEWHFLAGCLLGAAGIGLCFLAPKRKGVYWSMRSVLGSAAGTGLGAAFFLWINFSYAFWGDVSNLTWDHNIGMSNYGYLLYVTANAGEATVEAPEGYSVEKVEEILGRYREPAQRNSVLSSHSGDAVSPNLIMIMNESFSDLSVLGKLATTKPYLSFFNSLKENTIRGYAESSVYGGYTANSEFEFLTGCTKAFMPGNPYLQYMDDYLPSMISHIKGQEKYEEAIAIHPYHPSGYNRNRVYPLLDFDRFLSIEDFKNPVKVRKYISDASDYEMIEKIYESKKEGTSLCLFNVTMQNHSSYDDHTYQFENPVELTNYELQFEAEQYLSLIKMSDDALRDLISYFEKAEEPTLIVLFGDHQPHLPDYFYQKVMGSSPDEFDQEEAMKRYLVPFIIWANYNIGEEEIERTSLNYLSTLMMQTAGLELTDYQHFLLDLYQQVPSISANGYYDNHGELHSWDEKNNEVGQLLKEYEMVQYNYLFDKENRLDEHYQ